MKGRPQVVIVEDEEIFIKDIQRRLRKFDYDGSVAFSDGESVIEYIKTHTPDIILMDVELKGALDGVETAEQIKKIKDIPIIFLTGHTDDYIVERAKVTEPFAYVVKPLEDRELYVHISIVLQRAKSKRELKEREQWITSILNNLSEGVIVTNCDANVTFINPKIEQLLNISKENILGTDIDSNMEFLDDENRPFLESPVKKLLRTNKSVMATNVKLRNNDNKIVNIDYSASTLTDSKGTMTGAILTINEKSRTGVFL